MSMFLTPSLAKEQQTLRLVNNLVKAAGIVFPFSLHSSIRKLSLSGEKILFIANLAKVEPR